MASKTVLRATVDRIERGERGKRFAVLVFDDGQQLVLPESLLPTGMRPQQVVQLSLEPDAEETARREEEVRRLQRELFGE